ncbi:MAG: 2-oxoglutarate dehydrogenase complex dihydrolipoyllysine-residue succinyltransferase [Oligoflexales bacterium]
MVFEVRVPEVGESVQEGEIFKWHKATGDFVKRDDVLAELETDKATVEIVSEHEGVIELLKKEGETVKVKDIIAKISESKEGSAKKPQPAAKAKAEEPKVTGTSKKEQKPGKKSKDAPLSPAVGRLVEEHNLSPETIEASGKDGRLIKGDVLKHVSEKPEAAVVKPAFPTAPPSAPTQLRAVVVPGARGERREKMSRLRQKIAERLVMAQQTAAMLTTFNEIDMSTVMEVRKKYKDAFKEKYGINLGFMSFFLKAAIEALKAIPQINAYIEGDEVVYHDYCDIGVAVSTERGLIVPVIRNCEDLSFQGIEKAIADYAAKGREGKITLDELQGGTFTISNGGVFGSLLSTPILNPPQSAILGMHKIEERPVVVGGQVVVRPMMYVALSYDHRIVDGKEAVGFLVKIKEGIEDPGRLLLGV